MAKLNSLSLPELYARKITSSVEKNILGKEHFTIKSEEWCDKVCKLPNKNPPQDSVLLPSAPVDILIIQDYDAFDEPTYWKRGEVVEKKNKEIIGDIFSRALGKEKDVTFAITKLLKCSLTKENLVKGKAPALTTLSKCRPYLWQEIQNRNPKVIISLSTAVSKVIADKVTNNGNRGEILYTNTGIPLVVTLHPKILVMLRQNSSGAFWGPDFYSTILGDFKKAINLVRGTLRVPNLESALKKASEKISVARDIQAVGLMCDVLMELGLEGRALSYDLETNCIDPYGIDPYGQPAKIILAQFGFRNRDGELESYVFPMWHRDNNWYDPDEAWLAIKHIVSNPDIKKIGHNIKFDALFTFVTTGTRVSNIAFDTMLLLHAINSGVQGQYSLKQAVWDWLPDIELGNYEDKLPKLSKVISTEIEGDEDEYKTTEEID